MCPLGCQHLHADDRQNDGERRLEIPELLDEACESEVERSQAEDREHVRREHEKGVGGDREDRRDTVDGEYEVGRLHEYERDHERRDERLPALRDPELLAVVFFRDAEMAMQPAYDEGFFRGLFLLLDHKHPDRGHHQEDAKEIQDPFVARDQCCATGNHRAPHQQGSEHAPEQHAVLHAERHAEVSEDEGDDEDIVHRERELHDVSRQELDRREAPVVDLVIGRVDDRAEPGPMVPVGLVDETGERERECRRHGGEPERFFHRRRVGLLVEDPEVESEQHQDERDEAAPHEDHVFSCSIQVTHSGSASPTDSRFPNRTSGMTSRRGSSLSIASQRASS